MGTDQAELIAFGKWVKRHVGFLSSQGDDGIRQHNKLQKQTGGLIFSYKRGRRGRAEGKIPGSQLKLGKSPV